MDLLEIYENYIPLDVHKGTTQNLGLFYSLFTLFYFTGRFAFHSLNKQYSFLKYEESVSRVFSSLSQISIIYYLFNYGALWGIHAFNLYVINDMLYSVIFKPYLHYMVYLHHIVGVLISIIGIGTLHNFVRGTNQYKQCYTVSASLLAMEMSAPLLSYTWITKHENLGYLKSGMILVKPLLYVTYVLFRLIVPEYLFFSVLQFDWRDYVLPYFFVNFFITALLYMQVYWFLKLVKIYV